MKLIRVALKYLKKYPCLALITVAAIVASSFFEGASFGMLVPLIRSMTENREAISGIFVMMFFFLFFKNVFVYIANILIAKLRFRTVKDLRTGLMGRLLEYDKKYYDSVSTGYIIANMNTETERIGQFLLAVLQFVALSGRVLAYITLLFFISWRSSIVLFIMIAAVLIPIEFIMSRVKLAGKGLSVVLAEYNFKLTEILGGMRLIKSFGTEKAEKSAFGNASDGVRRFQFRTNKYIQLIIPLSEIFIFGLVITFFLILVNIAKVDIARAFPFIAAYMVVLARMLTQLNALNGRRSDAVGNLAAVENYERMYDPKGKKTIESGTIPADELSDSIELRNVDFSYIEGKDVLKDVSVKIPRGRVTALVGASGSGKSTLANLIARFYDVNKGIILVDGTDLKNIRLEDWTRKIGFVSQDVFIFNTTAKRNIAYGRENTADEEIIKAAKAANAHDFIMNLPEGYDTVLGERGVSLSGGQKQRISIARAILHNPEILILDEATSSLDSGTERLITEAVDRLTKERTVIAIAHRLSTILHADNIVVLEKGSIKEEGSHAELLRKNGLYKKLYDAQFVAAAKGE